MLSNKQSWEFYSPCMFYKDLRVYPAGIFMERFFTSLFCIEYATKLYQEGNIDVYIEYY